VLTQHYAMLQRNLLYTGVTRGKKLVVLVEGGRHRGPQRVGAQAVVEAQRVAAAQNRLSHDSSAWRVEPWSQTNFYAGPNVLTIREP